jgi:putative ABC transport system permease protein
VVADTRADGITDQRTPQVFTALTQDWDADLHLAVRRAGSSEDFGSALRRDVLAVDPALALSRTRSLESTSKVMLLPHRIMATAASTLGLLALFLCALGLYGVIAFAVTQQTREIGVRIALGAGRPRVIGRVLGRGLVLSLPGIGVGVLLSVGVGQIMQGVLPVRALDPITYTTTLGILAAVIVCACVAPAWRAASVRPMEALRFD